MSESRCPSPNALEALLEHAESSPRDRMLSAHLERCPRCASITREHRALRAMLRAGDPAEPQPAAARNRSRAALLAACAAAADPPRPVGAAMPFGRLGWRAAAGLAAAATLAVAAILAHRPAPQNHPLDTQAAVRRAAPVSRSAARPPAPGRAHANRAVRVDPVPLPRQAAVESVRAVRSRMSSPAARPARAAPPAPSASPPVRVLIVAEGGSPPRGRRVEYVEIVAEGDPEGEGTALSVVRIREEEGSE